VPVRDRIAPGVRLLFVGINPGVRSEVIGHHFAGYSNRFWKLLHDARIVPEPLGAEDDHRLPEWGIGITNLVPRYARQEHADVEVLKIAMPQPNSRHPEPHRIHRSGWLRAAVLGANDGIVSTASLIVGVAAADATRANILLAGTAGLVAGAMSMAAGEYVSVKSQEDTERADLKMEAEALKNNREEEELELAAIYQSRGLEEALSTEVARQLMQHDALGAHARDEIGITTELSARPLQAAFWSAAAFSAGGIAPVLTAALAPTAWLLWLIPVLAIALLGALGATAAATGGAPILRGAARVCFWGTGAMALTAAVGKLFGIAT